MFTFNQIFLCLAGSNHITLHTLKNTRVNGIKKTKAFIKGT